MVGRWSSTKGYSLQTRTERYRHCMRYSAKVGFLEALERERGVGTEVVLQIAYRHR